MIDSRGPTRFVLDETGRLVRRQPTTDVMQVYIPEALRACVMCLEHYPTTKSHPGVQRMFAAMNRCSYWESIIVDLNDFVRQCPPCAKNRLQKRRQTCLMILLPPKEPLFSKQTRTVALRRITAVTAASAFLTARVPAHGPPACVLSEQGRQTDNSFFRAVMKMLGTRCEYTTPLHPQTTGQVERHDRTLLNQIRAICEEQPLWQQRGREHIPCSDTDSTKELDPEGRPTKRTWTAQRRA